MTVLVPDLLVTKSTDFCKYVLNIFKAPLLQWGLCEIKLRKNSKYYRWFALNTQVQVGLLIGVFGKKRQDELGIRKIKHHTQEVAVMMTTQFCRPLTHIFFSLCPHALGTIQQARALGIQPQSRAGAGWRAEPA